MPTYEYACTACGEHLEAVQSFTDEPLTTCPHCGGDLRKVFGAVGIVLKGSGFYKNDSRTSGKPARSGASAGNGSSGEGTSSDAGTGGSSDAKSPAAKDTANGSKEKAAPSKAASAS